jgi:hypothetical protein
MSGVSYFPVCELQCQQTELFCGKQNLFQCKDYAASNCMVLLPPGYFVLDPAQVMLMYPLRIDILENIFFFSQDVLIGSIRCSPQVIRNRVVNLGFANLLLAFCIIHFISRLLCDNLSSNIQHTSSEGN